MDINLPILAYYPADDSKFIDPLYIPYQKTNVPLDDKGCYIPVNSWENMGNPNYVNPAHYRREWNMDFERIHPNDPCPGGWKSAGNGMCVRTREEEHSSNFYTPTSFGVKYQYFNGYTTGSPLNGKPCKPVLVDQDDSPTIKNASRNPFTGNFVVYHDPKVNVNSIKYSGLPSRHSYLGI